MDRVKGYTIEELRGIVGPIAESYGMRQVYLFGSRARGDCREDSDYDFCVVTSDDCGLFELGGFFAELRDALGVEIDLVCRESLRDNFRDEVLRDGILVYEARRRRPESTLSVEPALSVPKAFDALSYRMLLCYSLSESHLK